MDFAEIRLRRLGSHLLVKHDHLLISNLNKMIERIIYPDGFCKNTRGFGRFERVDGFLRKYITMTWATFANESRPFAYPRFE